jgi:hypothetical protein
MKYSVMYRGFLTSCNYGCGYCPFAKRIESRSQLLRDRISLARFTDWVSRQPDHDWRILFTPWGEALVRPWYREAMIRLSLLPNVVAVTAQTNLSCAIKWVSKCNLEHVGFWATYHPTEADSSAFISKVMQLRNLGASLSVGMVAVPTFFDHIEQIRKRLPPDIYMWLNAQQPRSRPYREDEISRLSEIDPHFRLTLRREPSLGKPCRTGELTFTVDGCGDMWRCHFVDDIIGNIYAPDWRSALRPRPCPNRFCNCFLGKAQLQAEQLSPVFGDQLLERVASGSSHSRYAGKGSA